MPVLKPPSPLTWRGSQFSVFLAGSIDNGSAPLWQAEAEKILLPYDPIIVNPRRDDWNPQATEAEQQEQIDWELEALERVTMIAMYFAPGSLSPITLLELGLHAGEKMVVCCPEGFWRRTNVVRVCERYSVEMVPTPAALMHRVIRRMQP